MKYLEKHIDFHLALAVVAVLGVTSYLNFQFDKAGAEFEALNASISSVVQGRERDLMENASVIQELDELGKSLDVLILN